MKPETDAQNPLFTVIVPAYNSSRTLGECLESLLEQSFPHWRCLVIDDGSEDGTPELVSAFCQKDARIELIRQNNAGPSQARNRGIQQATTPWVTFLDSDDRYLPNALDTFRKTADRFADDPLFGVMSGHFCESLEAVQVDPQVTLVDIFAENFLPNHGPELLPSALAVARDCFESVGSFRTIECEDLEFWLRLTTRYKVAHIRQTTTLYRQDESDSRNQKLKKSGTIAQAHREILEGYLQEPVVIERLRNTPELASLFGQRSLAAVNLLKALESLDAGNSQLAGDFYTKSRTELPEESPKLLFYLKDLLFYPQNDPCRATLRYAASIRRLAMALPRGQDRFRNELIRSASDSCFLEAKNHRGLNLLKLGAAGVAISPTVTGFKSVVKLAVGRLKQKPAPIQQRPLKVGIYNEPNGPSIGGSELLAAILAQELSSGHRVDLIHRKPGLTRSSLAHSTGTDLEKVQLRFAEVSEFRNMDYRTPVRSLRKARQWADDLSRPYDLFICFQHGLPPFCQARRGALVVLFPFATPLHKKSLEPATGLLSGLKAWLARRYATWEWQQRMATYQVRMAISSFTADWTRRRWEIDCQVVHPPTSLQFVREEKRCTILSVGRFAVAGHTKKQDAMMRTFFKLSSRLSEWEYACVGAVSDYPGEREFFAELEQAAAGSRVRLQANIEPQSLIAEYQRAKIFWHAAGFDSDENLHPEMTEHFGIVTVEAMSAGCVPVVANRGGQKDIVEHGVSGFLWSTLAELENYTLQLAEDEQLRQRLETGARKRAEKFSRENHLRKNRALLQPLIDEVTASLRKHPQSR